MSDTPFGYASFTSFPVMYSGTSANINVLGPACLISRSM